jgi:VanZ family protein
LDYKVKIFQAFFVLWVITITILSLVEPENFTKIDVKNSDKYVHFITYFWLTLLLYLALPKNQLNLNSRLLFSFLFSVIYGIIIELLQGLITVKRQPEIMDVFANTFGSFIAVLVVLFLLPKVKFLK